MVKIPNIDPNLAVEAHDGQAVLVDQLPNGALGAAEVFGSLDDGEQPGSGRLQLGLLLGNALSTDGRLQGGQDGLWIYGCCLRMQSILANGTPIPVAGAQGKPIRRRATVAWATSGHCLSSGQNPRAALAGRPGHTTDYLPLVRQ